MTTAIRKQAIVGPDGKIEITTPELTPGRKVQLILWLAPSDQEKCHAVDILNEAPDHQLFKTAEEVDAYIREERDSWDR